MEREKIAIKAAKEGMGADEPQSSDLRLRTILNAIQTGIVVVDAEMRSILDANPAALSLFGKSKHEVVGHICHKFICPAEIGQCPIRGQKMSMDNSECVVLNRAGEKVPVLKTVSSAFLDGRMCLVESFADISRQKKAEKLLKASLAEKDVLLREIHHRVKNNLQVISSLLNLQTDSITDNAVRSVLSETRDRVRSMSLVHEKLYQSNDLTTIDFRGYLETLGSYLLRSYERDRGTVSLKLNISNVLLGIDTVIPCGLVVTELVSNALKHAFPPGRRGEIWISLRQENDSRYAMEVGNNGSFFPSDVDFANTNTLGLQLVMMLVKQLNGTIELSRERGTEFIITFYDVRQRKEEAVQKETYPVSG